MPHIVSTLTSDQVYADWVSNPGGINVLKKKVHIKGGANVAIKQDHGGVSTEAGKVTEISDEDLAWLEKNPDFVMHKDKGFIKVVRAKPNPEKVAKDMTSADTSAPLTSKDFQEGGRANAPADLKLKEGKKIK